MAKRRNIVRKTLDDALRDVPLPAGMFARLRQVGNDSDNQHDSPAFAMTDGSNSIAADSGLVDERSIDESLRSVELPHDLLTRLHQLCGEAANSPELASDSSSHGDPTAPSTGTGSPRRRISKKSNTPGHRSRLASTKLPHSGGVRRADRWSRDLAAVPLPDGFLDRVRRLARPGLQRSRAPLAQAALILVAVGLSYLAAMSAFVSTAYRLDSASDIKVAENFASQTLDEVEHIEPIHVGWQDEDRVSVALEHSNEPVLMDVETSKPPSLLPPFADLAAHAEVLSGDWGRHAVPQAWVFADSIRSGVDELPEIGIIPTSSARGLDAPHLRGFDWRYFLKYDEWPVIWLNEQTDKGLRTSQVPLCSNTDSYELTRRYLSEGELPPPKLIRKEEFLAAANYAFPPPRAAVGLSATVGPSPFREGHLRLLQLGVQAGDTTQSKRSPVHLVVAVDTSNSMNWGGRLSLIQQALRDLIGRLGPHDRLSIVAYSDQARVVIEETGREHAGELHQAVDALQPEHATNMAAGVRLAYLVAASAIGRDQAAKRDTRLCVVTDGLQELDQRTVEHLDGALKYAFQEGIGLSIIDLRRGQLLATDFTPPRQFAKAKHIQYLTADGLAETRAALAHVFTSQPQLAGSNVKISVTFNPEVVAAYKPHEEED